ncbi:hypothetical protein [Piscinibacter sakaiensis]|uniref:Uncharacterized protein n=1 Tax=Piscinibacter sakaiensis TaxID=1547922 RepID=A0A0K8P6W2_PISS1|nr:hypothetical protein [Piscinibacter sakaiensis]GAP38259.1 hypothetical protein ISF6_4453 [Piscinibacter sakaiensis]
MDPLLASQRALIDAWQRCCGRRPVLHRRRLAALARERALADAAPDIRGFLAAGGQGLEAGRAPELDRWAAEFARARSLGSPIAAEAALQAAAAALSARDAAGWLPALAQAEAAAAPWRQRAVPADGGLAEVLRALLWQAAALPGGQEARAVARTAWQRWGEADPAGRARALHGAGPAPAALARLPWRDEALAAALDLLRTRLPLAPAGSTARGGDAAAPAPAPAPDPAGQAARWRALLDAWERGLAAAPGAPDASAAALAAAGPAWDTRPDQALAPYEALTAGSGPTARAARALLAAGRGATDALDVQRRWVEAGLVPALGIAAVEARLDEDEAREAGWPSPLRRAHARALRDRLAEVRTDTELVALTAHAEACLAVEHAWQALLFDTALVPLQAAALAAMLGPELTAPDLPGPAVDAARALLGGGPRARLAAPWLAGWLAGNLAPALAAPDADPLAALGEAGHGVLPALRGWQAWRAAHGAPALDAPALPAALAELLDAAGAAEAPPADRRVWLWGVPAPARAAEALLRSPSRPALAGWAPGAGGDEAL